MEAEDNSKTRDEMFVIVSHDLRSSLGVIQMTIEQVMLKDTIKECELFLGMIARHTIMALQIVDDVMDASCLQRGLFSVEPVRQDIVEVLKDCVNSVQLIAGTYNVSVVDELPESAFALVDKNKLSRAVVNLLINAIKFSPPTGTVQVKLRDSDVDVECIIEDTGPGVPREMRDVIFEKFQQAKADSRGFGLGLFISKAIIESHKGKIWVDEAPIQGAAFHFKVPRA